jgi:hypothetical protein
VRVCVRLKETRARVVGIFLETTLKCLISYHFYQFYLKICIFFGENEHNNLLKVLSFGNLVEIPLFSTILQNIQPKYGKEY